VAPVRFLETITVVILAATALLVTADSVSRRLFNSPIHGVFESTQLVTLIVISVGIAGVTATDTHIILEVGRNWLGRRSRVVVDALNGLACFAFFALLTWYCVERGYAAWLSGAYWIGYINIPTTIAWLILAVTAFFSAGSSLRSMFIPADRSGYESDIA
jgi:TRAP-type C4-dicarboxylate transport system permease small subunit